MDQNGFFFAEISIDGGVKFQCFRAFAERMFSIMGLRVDRYSLAYEAANGKHSTATYKYESKNKNKFDDLLLSSCSYSAFRAFGSSKEIWDDRIRLHLTHKKGTVFSIHATWAMQEACEQSFVLQVDSYKQLLAAFFDVSYLLAGCMDSPKAVDFFILGMLHETQTALEQKVAYNIQLASYLDTRMPYLFPYAYCAEMPKAWRGESEADRTVIFRPLLLKPLDSYEFHEGWKKCYAMLMDKNLLIPISAKPLPRGGPTGGRP